MRIVAFDLSLTCTGWCDGAGVGTLVPPKGYDRGVPRLDWIRARVMEKADGAQLVAIEGYSYGAKGSSFLSLAELGGVIRWNLYVRKIPYVVIAPSSRAMFATGKGNAKKEEVFAAAIRKINYRGNSHDEADAMWLHRMAECKYERTSAMMGLTGPTEYEKRALSKIEWPTLNLETV